MKPLILAFAIAVAFSAPLRAQQPDSAISVAQQGSESTAIRVPDICAVVRHPAKFQGKRIEVRAAVLTNMRHGIVLISEGCKRGIQMDAAERVRQQDDYLTFLNALVSEGGIVGTKQGKSVAATFTGTFRLDEESRHTMLLDVTRIEAIEVKIESK